MVIGVNCGHTLKGAGSGAIGFINESEETRNVGNVLINYLEKLGHTVIPCTDDYANSVSENLSEIVRLANAQDLDWLISIHFNAGRGRGSEIYTYGKKECSEANNILRKLGHLGFVNRGIKDGSHLYVVKNAKAKSMLIEVCFVDTKYDTDLYDICGADAVAKSIAEGITGKSLTEKEEEEMIYNYVDKNMPDWARPTIQKLVDKGLLKGNEKGELGLNETMLKVFVVNDRAGLYD